MKPLRPMDRQIKPGRALFGVVGVARVLAPGVLTISKGEFAQAVKLEPRLCGVIADFLDGKREAVPFPPYDHEKTSALLFRAIDPEFISEKLAQFRGNSQGDEFLKIASDAMTYLQGKIPRRFRQTLLGPKPLKPSRGELIGWQRYLTTASDPVWGVRQLLAATLGREHIDTLQAVWPDVLSAVRQAAEEGLADRIEKDADYTLTRRQTRQLGVLLGSSETPPDFVKALQDTFLTEPGADHKRAEPEGKPDEAIQTPVQRVAMNL